jgi:hypothetical protein
VHHNSNMQQAIRMESLQSRGIASEEVHIAAASSDF